MRGFRLGRSFGINIHIDWSWFLIFLLVMWSLAVTFGQIHRAWTLEMRWGQALLASCLFFVSVLAHELAHALAAQARGVAVKNITLFMFGGVANLEREPASPGEEVFITIVGPLTSLLLGVIFVLLATSGFLIFDDAGRASTLLSQLQPFRTVLAWLGSVNLMVGIFNLIPAFPLDGGRLLRSMFWAVTNDLRRATRWAAVIGQVIAWGFGIAGSVMLFGVAIPFLGVGIFNGLWIIFIGWFLYNAASNGYRHVMIQDFLGDVPVRRVMQTQVPMVSSETSVDELVNGPFAQSDGQTMLVTAGEEVIGLVGMNDVQKSKKTDWKATSVGQIMTPLSQLEYVTPEQDAADALDRLQQMDLRHIPVKWNNQVIGLLRQKDILRWLQFQSEVR